MKKQFLGIGLFIFINGCSVAQPLPSRTGFTRQDSLRGSVGPERAWWNVLHYDVSVTPHFETKSITGKTTIRYQVVLAQQTDYMQIDLQQPLLIDSIYYNSKKLVGRPFQNEGNVWHIPLPREREASLQSITFFYHGKPREAINPPWDGGWIFAKDARGRPWMTVACQGQGASSWFPCKDHQSDEPDHGAVLTVSVPRNMVAVGNGRRKNQSAVGALHRFTWEVKSPINNYTIIPYIGHYVSWADTLQGEKGTLDLTYWALDHDLDKAKKQFEQVKPTLRAFEYWFGPYPFYEDGYQLIQSPHLGMEHQSAVAYGNQFKNGYLGMDLSGTGWGKKWDYIIVHETGHEWFGNNITTKDIADMWVHEGFTDYSETLFIEYYYGKAAANEYVQGLRKNIANDKPIIGPYGVNEEGSGDMYFKGANLIHTLRQVIDNDQLFREILRGLNRQFYRQTVTSGQVEQYLIQKSGKDLSGIFDQYLRTTQIPVLQWHTEGEKVGFKWTNCIKGFNMPVKLATGQWIYPTTEEQNIKWDKNSFTDADIDRNFYIKLKKV